MTLLKFIKLMWWIFLASIPVAIYGGIRYLSGYNCPPVGDCYEMAALAKRHLESLYVIAAVGIWPPCVWHLGLGAIAKWLWRRNQRRAAQ